MSTGLSGTRPGKIKSCGCRAWRVFPSAHRTRAGERHGAPVAVLRALEDDAFALEIHVLRRNPEFRHDDPRTHGQKDGEWRFGFREALQAARRSFTSGFVSLRTRPRGSLSFRTRRTGLVSIQPSSRSGRQDVR